MLRILFVLLLAGCVSRETNPEVVELNDLWKITLKSVSEVSEDPHVPERVKAKLHGMVEDASSAVARMNELSDGPELESQIVVTRALIEDFYVE